MIGVPPRIFRYFKAHISIQLSSLTTYLFLPAFFCFAKRKLRRKGDHQKNLPTLLAAPAQMPGRFTLLVDASRTRIGEV
jgi:hypothetical protein